MQLWVCRDGKHVAIQHSKTLKRNLFINTVVYLEMCCQEGEKKKEKRIHLKKIKINKMSVTRVGVN